MPRHKSRKKYTKKFRKKVWDFNKGFRICPFRTLKNTYGNYRISPYCLDFRKEYSVFINKKDIPDYINTGYDFIDYIKELIDTYFEGSDGTYWIGGKNKQQIYKEDYLYNCPIALIKYTDGKIGFDKYRSYSKKYGKHKSRSTIYHIFIKYPELKSMIK